MLKIKFRAIHKRENRTFFLSLDDSYAEENKVKKNWLLPMIIRNRIKPPALVIMTQICAAKAPKGPNDSLMTPAYVVVSPECVNLMRKSTETSARTATMRIVAKAGITPRTFRIAGIDMIPAPTMLVATLNTAPETVAGFCPGLDSGKRGTCTPVAGDISAVRGKREVLKEIEPNRLTLVSA